MATSSSDLREVVGAAELDEHAQRAYDLAVAMVAKYVGSTEGVPQAAIDQAVLEVGASIYRRKAEPSQSAAVSLVPNAGVPVRQPRDPMSVARSILAPWLPGSFA